MLRHAYYWRAGAWPQSGGGPAPPDGGRAGPAVQRYVERGGRPGATALVAIVDFQPVGAAWYRLFKADNPGYGFIDEETPELSIAVVPSKRGTGLGSELLEALMVRGRHDGFDAVSLSVEKDTPAVALYERHGFRRVREDDGAYTMRADLRDE